MIVGGIIFVLGLIFGSFLSALEYRIDKGVSLSGRSFCPKCKGQIAWYDNIPVLSWIVLAGKCRKCKKPISIQYPIVELLTAFAFVGAGLVTDTIPSLNNYIQSILEGQYVSLGSIISAKLPYILLAAISFILILVALHDAKTKYVLSRYVYVAAFLSVTYNLLIGNVGLHDVASIYYYLLPFILSAFVPALLFFLIHKASKGKAMGAGDAEIAIAIGLLLGFPNTLVAYYFAFIVGAIWGGYLLLSRKAKLKSEMPLGPFLIAGTFFALYFGEQIFSLYAKIFLGF
ncbi:MAG: prepilin peptidase [Patescibacteria group bacterium]|nr:prepilin peptidase [Patescibacteria group bacterium]